MRLGVLDLHRQERACANMQRDPMDGDASGFDRSKQAGREMQAGRWRRNSASLAREIVW